MLFKKIFMFIFVCIFSSNVLAVNGIQEMGEKGEEVVSEDDAAKNQKNKKKCGCKTRKGQVSEEGKR